MSQSVEDRVSVDIQGGESYLFRAHGSILTFPGFKKAFLSEKETKSKQGSDLLPPLHKKPGCGACFPES
jgi:DNA topoisomerase IA